MSSSVDLEIEHLYMPSNWVKRVTPEESVPLYVKNTTDSSRAARADPSARLGVRFGAGASDLVDIFNEEGTTEKIIVFVAGGYWVELNGEISAFTVAPLVADGHTVIVVHYDRAPVQDMAGIVDQVERAAQWILNYAEEKQKKVWFSGHSAGAHLCAMVLSSSWFTGLPQKSSLVVQGVVHLSGIYNLTPILATSVNTVLRMTKEVAERFSPISQINLDRIRQHQHLKHHIVIAEFDGPPFHQQAKQYRKELDDRKLTTSLTILSDMDHFSLAEDLCKLDSVATQTFRTLIE